MPRYLQVLVGKNHQIPLLGENSTLGVYKAQGRSGTHGFGKRKLLFHHIGTERPKHTTGKGRECLDHPDGASTELHGNIPGPILALLAA